MPNFLEPSWQSLSQYIGRGRKTSDNKIKLCIEHHPICDLKWVNKQNPNQSIWTNYKLWSEWLSADYPTIDIHHYDPEFYPLLTSLSLEIAQPFFLESNFIPADLARDELEQGWYLVIRLQHEEKTLSLVLKGWEPEQILQITENWFSCEESVASPELLLPLSIAVKHLALKNCLALKAGDGIVFNNFSNIRKNEVWLLFGKNRISMTLGSTEVSINMVEESNRLTLDQGDINELHDLPLTLVVEVGMIQLSLTDIAALTPGSIVPASTSLNGGVRLMINGACIGYGSLIEMNDCWVVRVNTLINSENLSKKIERLGN